MQSPGGSGPNVAPDEQAGAWLPPVSGPVAEQATPAGWWSRLGATLLDTLVLLAPAAVLGGVGSVISTDAGTSVGVIVYLLGALFYAPVMLMTRDGQTLGKQALGIRVVASGGGSLSAGQVFGRELALKGLLNGIVPLLAVFDSLWPLANDRNRALHDKWAGTEVHRAR
jgi:uncharacterized RDD family membrane protein YckC